MKASCAGTWEGPTRSGLIRRKRYNQREGPKSWSRLFFGWDEEAHCSKDVLHRSAVIIERGGEKEEGDYFAGAA